MPLELPKIKLNCVQQTFSVQYVLLISNSLKIGKACVEMWKFCLSEYWFAQMILYSYKTW